MKREFRPKDGAGFGRIRQLRHANIEKIPRGKGKSIDAFDEYLVTFDVDSEHTPNEGCKIKKIPVRFFMAHEKNPHANGPNGDAKNAVLYSMSMQDIEGIGQRMTSSMFGPEGKKLYSKYEGYPHALVALGTFLHSRGVKRLWVPSSSALLRIKPQNPPRHILGKIYDKSAEKIGMDKMLVPVDFSNPDSEPVEYHVIDTHKFKGLVGHLK